MALPGVGGGDFVANPGSQKFEWEKLPDLVQVNVFKYLNRTELLRMQQTCRDAQYMAEKRFGVHVTLPCRRFSEWKPVFLNGKVSVVRNGPHITDEMLSNALLAMERKVVRSLCMNETPPDLNPTTFDRFIKQPWRLLELSLKYVDVRVLNKFLTSCRNLSELRYETGIYRTLPNGLYSKVVHLASFQPVHIPTGNDFIQLLPGLPDTFQLRYLSSLSLSIRNNLDVQGESDLANVLYLLLALPPATVNLKRFKFRFAAHPPLAMHDGIQILGMIGDFLSRTPTLQKFQFMSSSNFIDRHMHLHRRIAGISQPVTTSLIQKFGSIPLKNIQTGVVLGQMNQQLIPDLQQLMTNAGRTLTRLQHLELRLNDTLESNAYRALLLGLPSLQTCRVVDVFERYRNRTAFNNELYDFLLSAAPPLNEPLPFMATVERLTVNQYCPEGPPVNQTISLNQLLERSRNLKRLKITRSYVYAGDDLRLLFDDRRAAVEPNEAGDVVVIHEERMTQRPTFTIQPTLNEDDSIFHRLEVLQIGQVWLLARDAVHLLKCKNLRELSLKTFPGYDNPFFGMNSEDLLKLISSLRRLEKISVGPVMFPTELPPELATAHRTALRMIGHLEPHSIGNRSMCSFSCAHDVEEDGVEEEEEEDAEHLNSDEEEEEDDDDDIADFETDTDTDEDDE